MLLKIRLYCVLSLFCISSTCGLTHYTCSVSYNGTPALPEYKTTLYTLKFGSGYEWYQKNNKSYYPALCLQVFFINNSSKPITLSSNSIRIHNKTLKLSVYNTFIVGDRNYKVKKGENRYYTVTHDKDKETTILALPHDTLFLNNTYVFEFAGSIDSFLNLLRKEDVQFTINKIKIDSTEIEAGHGLVHLIYPVKTY